MKHTRTWVLIADATRARVLETTTGTSGMKPVPGLAFETDIPPAHELVDDRQPRSMESVGHARHAITQGIDPRRKEKRRFVDHLAAEIEQRAGDFDRLVIVAAPQALGDLRKALSEAVKAKVTSEVAKDLTKTPDHELPSHLEL